MLIIYTLLIYLGIKAQLSIWWFIACTVGICFRLFNYAIEKGRHINYEQEIKKINKELKRLDKEYDNE